MIQEWVNILTVSGISFLILAVLKIIPAYITEKGKNWATKEDVAQITRIAEGIKSKLAHANVINKAQFEVEFQSCQSLWKAGREAMASHIRWRSLLLFDADASSDPKAKESWTTRAGDYIDASRTFSELLYDCRPFVVQSVLEAFTDIDEMFVSAKSSFELALPKSHAGIEADRKAIDAGLQRCAEAIRARLASLNLSD